jgi:hypothetical protein
MSEFNLLNKIAKQFMLNEGEVPSANILTYVQSLQETLSNMKPRTQTESRRLNIARMHLKEIKRSARKLHERVSVLEEKLSILEESKEE